MASDPRSDASPAGDELAAQAEAQLQQADALHDDEPAAAAALLREVVPALLAPACWPRYAFLVNHLLVEKLGRPHEAWQFQQAVLAAAGEAAPLPLLRHAAAAACLAGDTAAEARLIERLATAAAVSPAQAAGLTLLAAASFQVPTLAGDAAGEAAQAALAPLAQPAWERPGGLDGAAAALTNNLASDLAERPVAELASAPLRAALREAARLSQQFWHRAGQWVHHARAHYLRALAANALGDTAEAESQARAGLVLLAHHDTEGAERVDQAFLRLELAHALARQGRLADAAVERAQADALAADFGDEGLARWYRGRVARQAALDAGPGGEAVRP